MDSFDTSGTLFSFLTLILQKIVPQNPRKCGQKCAAIFQHSTMI